MESLRKDLLRFILCCWIGLWAFYSAYGRDPFSVSSDLTDPAGAKTSWRLAVQKDQTYTLAGQQAYIVTLKEDGSSSATAQALGELILWWIPPSGPKTSIPMKPVDEGVWANRIEMGGQPGTHRLVLMVVTTSAQQTVEEVCGQEYLLQLPEAHLSQERTWTLPAAAESISLPVSVRKIVKHQDTGWSIQTIVIMVALFHLVLSLFIGIIFTIYRRLHPSLRWRFAAPPSHAPMGQKVFQNPLPEDGFNSDMGEESRPVAASLERERSEESKSVSRGGDLLDATLKDLVLDALSAIGPAKTVSEAKDQDDMEATMIEPEGEDFSDNGLIAVPERSDGPLPEELSAEDPTIALTEEQVIPASQEESESSESEMPVGETSEEPDELEEPRSLASEIQEPALEEKPLEEEAEQPTLEEQPPDGEESVNKPSVNSQSLSSEELMLALQKMMDELEQVGDEEPAEPAIDVEQEEPVEETILEEPARHEEPVLVKTKPEPAGAINTKMKSKPAYPISAESDEEDLKIDLNDLSF